MKHTSALIGLSLMAALMLPTPPLRAAEPGLAPLAADAAKEPEAQNITLLPHQTINDYGHPFMVGAMVSPLGVGGEFQYGLPFGGWAFNHFAVRGGFNYLGFNLKQSLGTGNNLSLSFSLSTPELLIDLYPSASSGFHFTVGMMFPLGGANTIFSSDGITLRGNKYANINANMKIKINSTPFAPYLGVGIKSWSGARANRNNWIGSNVDIGFLLIKPKATGSLSCGQCDVSYDPSTGNPRIADILGNPTITLIDLQQYFNQDIIDKANEAIKNIPIYPVIRWTVSVMF
ncbi:MAG: hypothetical protein QM537_07820 [Candidatus Symbiobacter sp.]|nr:hypothetical protein [Candidatus Symbiobacter sp.]